MRIHHRFRRRTRSVSGPHPVDWPFFPDRLWWQAGRCLIQLCQLLTRLLTDAPWLLQHAVLRSIRGFES